MLDIHIEGAKIHDGTGNPWYLAGVGVKDSRIAAIGVVTEKARKKINAAGLALCPGFVDVHTHADGIIKSPRAQNMLRQGVTTVVSGNCGGSAFPIREMLDKVEAARPAINYATLVGHGTIRTRVMGTARRRPTRKELAQMRRLVQQAMREGAVGMSTGLFYVPGAYAEVGELVELSKVVRMHGGLYASHMRSTGGKLFESLQEAAAIGKKAQIPVEISHFKVLHKKGRTRKSRAGRALAAVAQYRRDGIDMTFDVYPYDASYTGLSAVAIPPWVSKDGKLNERLKDDAVRRQIRDEVAGNIAWMGGAGRITIAKFPPDRSVEGKSLAQIARARKRIAVTTAMDMVVEGGPSCIFHAMRAGEVRKIIASEHSMIGSDGGIVRSRQGIVHPRNYGTFPRVLRQYVRELKVMSFEEAIRKMTSLPARKFGILDRGLVAVGMRADLVLFDPATVGDRATFDRPHEFPVGIRFVIVNGHVAWNGRSISRSRAGTAIRKG